MSRFFSHIYVEDKALSYPLTISVLDKFSDSQIIKINHYKDIFNRPKQDFQLQKSRMKLILAVKEENFIYEGSPFCQNFGNTDFFYCSTMLNCLYNCDYCYLQGMYQSAYITAFVNIQDFYDSVSTLKADKPYIAVSYDTDLLAFEGIIPYVSGWLDFAARHNNITLEIRTKSANFKAISHKKSIDNVILAWTLSPDNIIDKYENAAPSLNSRIESINKAILNGWKVRLCFDPLIRIADWKAVYSEFINFTFSRIKASSILDIGIGAFRMPAEYLKRIKKSRIDSDLIHYPFKCYNGIAGYPENIEKELLNYIYGFISNHFDKERIYL